MKIADIENATREIEEKEIDEFNQLLKNVKKIHTNSNGSEIELSNGEKISLKGKPSEIEMNINRCVYCGKIGDKESPLYTMDNETFLCKHCTILAFKTYIDNDFDMPTIEEMKTTEKFDAYKY